MSNSEFRKEVNMSLNHDTTYFRHNLIENQEEYINSLINLSFEKKLSKEQKEKKINKLAIRQEKQSKSDSSYRNDSEPFSEESPKIKRSPFHNFQKHFVITLRRSVVINWEAEEEFVLNLAREIWEIFKRSTKFTKQFFSVILGNSNNKISEKLSRKYGLEKCWERYSQEEIYRAQNFLRTEVIRSLKSIEPQLIMYDRRIKKKEEFKLYFYKVLSELEEGEMNKRMNLKRK